MELDVTFQERTTDKTKCRDRLKKMVNLPNSYDIDYTEECRAARLHQGCRPDYAILARGILYEIGTHSSAILPIAHHPSTRSSNQFYNSSLCKSCIMTPFNVKLKTGP